MRVIIAIAASACLGSALLSTWLLTAVVPEVRMATHSLRSEAVRQRAVVDDMIERSIAVAMFERDYGEVQDLLGRYVAAGHFSQAVVLNVQRNVVASLGSNLDLEVGRPAPEMVLKESRKMPLALQNERVGELYARTPAAGAARIDAAERQLELLRNSSLSLSVLSWLGVLALSVLLVVRR